MPRLRNQAEIEAAIRAEYAAGGTSHSKLAAKHDRSERFILRVCRGVTPGVTPPTADAAPAPTPAPESAPAPDAEAEEGEEVVIAEPPPRRRKKAATPAQETPGDEPHSHRWVL